MNRRQIMQGAGATLLTASAASHAAMGAPATTSKAKRSSLVQAGDGTNLYLQDWGDGRPVVFLAAWTLSSAVWGEHIAALTAAGYRCLALDRRGHGRSDAPCGGYDADTLADDVAAVFEQRDLKDATLIAHSMGAIEAVRYLARHGSARVGKLVLIAPTTPFLMKTEDNPDAIPANMIEAQKRKIAQDCAKWIAENEVPFFVPDTIPETRAWIKAMMLNVPLAVALECYRTFATTDTRKDLTQIDLPTLILHGDKDASVPLPLTGVKTAKLMKGSRLVVYKGAPHALTLTHRARLLGDISAFIAT